MTRHPRAQRVVPTRDVHRVRATQHRVGHVVRRGVLGDVRQRANHRGARHAVGRPARPQREGVLVDHQLTGGRNGRARRHTGPSVCAALVCMCVHAAPVSMYLLHAYYPKPERMYVCVRVRVRARA